VFVFFILVLTITAQQIDVSTVSNGRAPTADEIEARYLTKWRPVFIITIMFGILLSLVELEQMGLSGFPLEIKSGKIQIHWGQIVYSLGKYFRYVMEQPFHQVH
jgi:hypothetical protein